VTVIVKRRRLVESPVGTHPTVPATTKEIPMTTIDRRRLESRVKALEIRTLAVTRP
jgi:hypothetical protein